MEIHVIDKETCNIVGTFSEMAAAMALFEALADQDEKSEDDYYISF